MDWIFLRGDLVPSPQAGDIIFEPSFIHLLVKEHTLIKIKCRILKLLLKLTTGFKYVLKQKNASLSAEYNTVALS